VDARLAAAAVALLLLGALASTLYASSMPAALSEDEYEEEEYEEEGEAGELAEALGEAAWNLGVPLTLAFVAYKYAYIKMAKRRVRLPLSLSWALKIHVAASLVLGAAALLHGLMLIEYAGPVEYAAAALVALVTLSGAALYFARGRAARYARLIHAQRILSLLTLAVVALHVTLMD